MKRISALALLILMASAGLASAAEYRLVANTSVRTSALSRAAVAALFMKKTAKWGDGTPVVPVDQTDRAAVRAAFTSDVHGKSVAAVKSYWQQQIFSGRDVPPVEKASDAQVLEFVRRTPGAIGYVSAGTPVSGVTVIDVE